MKSRTLKYYDKGSTRLIPLASTWDLYAYTEAGALRVKDNGELICTEIRGEPPSELPIKNGFLTITLHPDGTAKETWCHADGKVWDATDYQYRDYSPDTVYFEADGVVTEYDLIKETEKFYFCKDIADGKTIRLHKECKTYRCYREGEE